MHPLVARGSSAVSERLTIGKLGSATGTKVETIRYYEQIGLLPAPARSAGNYRTYQGEHLRRLSFIRRARDLGFSIDQVRELMGLADRREQSCMAVNVIANQHRDAITRKIADLTALAGELDTLIESCSRNTVADCRIIEALAPSLHSG
ncbi:helix-turn-helix domain-containing protein [Sphingobium sp. HBC34]|uniref:Helix-turn-helix domain-containing protein n=1 Tax=Sphingobium cyanobacteriorum TaxID=3063954 RepID=A0ABT8ZS86_9SPHN|nr:helix-turn-helix domain-containing protein [Sphingobium sp. HBC34]MDO7836814.1 helix-turn-helix domain-containing protein [Sphingobium sp. HBC34]